MIHIEEINPFKTTIFVGDLNLSNEIVNNIVDNIINIKNNNKGFSISNAGGWQSESYHGDIHFMTDVLSLITSIVNNISSNKFNIINSLCISNYWFNINKKYNYNKTHTHPGSVFSAIIYLKCPSNSGDLVFQRSDSFDSYMNVNFSGTNEYNFTSWKITPENNMFIVFPSYIPHYVEQNLTEDLDDNRISIAFNFYKL